MKAFLLFVVACLSPRNPIAVEAWGKLGHQAIANVAWDLLTTEKQEAVQSCILGSTEPTVHSVCAEPCSPMAYVADWADTVRYTKEYHWSGPLHFVDIQDMSLPDTCNQRTEGSLYDWRPECNVVLERDCPHQMCVVGSVVNYTLQLQMSPSRNSNKDNGNSDARQQKVALMFMTHFIGDIHQPLHVSRKSDIGGNTISVKLQNWRMSSLSTGRRQRHKPRGRALTAHPGHDFLQHHGLNLHAVWDDSLIETFLERSQEDEESLPFWSFLYKTNENRTLLEQAMHDVIQEAQRTGPEWSAWMACPHGHVTSCATSWAQESWLLAQEHAYVHVNGTPIKPGDALPFEYYEHNLPVVVHRLSAAAVRLAATVQLAFGEGFF